MTEPVRRLFAPALAALALTLAIPLRMDAGAAHAAAAAAAAAPRSVVLIVNDTMRRDRVGAYGGPAATPAFDAFAAGAARFDDARTQAPWTKPSMATLFTSLYPSQHGVASDPFLRAPDGDAPVVAADRLAPGLRTLAEVLHDGGRRTVAYVSNPWLLGRFGFDQGFDVYDDSFASWDLPGSALTDRALHWLATEGREGRPFLLYLHYLDSHRPYPALEPDEARALAQPPRPDEPPFLAALRQKVAGLVRLVDGRPLAAVAPPSPAHLLRAYDKGIERFDVELGRVLAALRDHPAGRDAIVIVTSDHGEALYEHGHGNHGTRLFEEELAVPLAVRIPGVRPDALPRRAPVGLIDLLPTLCDALDVPCPERVAGVSWLSDAPRERVVAEGTMVDPSHRALVEGRYKLVYEPVPPGRSGPPAEGRAAFALYDLARDPHEMHDLLARPDPAALTRYRAMAAHLENAVAPMQAPPADALEMTPEEVERLRAIGYVH